MSKPTKPIHLMLSSSSKTLYYWLNSEEAKKAIKTKFSLDQPKSLICIYAVEMLMLHDHMATTTSKKENLIKRKSHGHVRNGLIQQRVY